jgi:hypothetical protein
MGQRIKTIHLSIAIFFVSWSVQSQILVKTDALGFTYELYENVLIKQESPPFPQFQFGLLNFGIPTSIDLTNPLRPFVFCKDQGCIVFLDNELNQAGSPFYLNSNNNVQITACCGSKGNAFWIYDHLNRQLQLLDRNGVSIIQTPRLEIQTELIQLVELGQNLYGIDVEGNVFIFNLYGNLKEKSYLNGAKFLTNQDVIYLLSKDGIIHQHNGIWLTTQQLHLNEISLNLIDIKDSKIIENNPKTGTQKVIYNLNN